MVSSISQLIKNVCINYLNVTDLNNMRRVIWDYELPNFMKVFKTVFKKLPLHAPSEGSLHTNFVSTHFDVRISKILTHVRAGHFHATYIIHSGRNTAAVKCLNWNQHNFAKSIFHTPHNKSRFVNGKCDEYNCRCLFTFVFTSTKIFFGARGVFAILLIVTTNSYDIF